MLILPERHTYADYLTWPDDRCGELIDGVAYIREPPGPSRLHQEVVTELLYQVRGALEGKSWRAYVAPFDVRLPKCGERDEEIDTVVQPDVCIICNVGKLDARGMCGAPTWVAEVLSPGTASHDQRTKLRAYERAGVAEVWLIHPIERTLTLNRLVEGQFAAPIVVGLQGKTPITAVPGVSVDWDRILGRLV